MDASADKRIGTAEREAALATLSEHLAAGRLDVAEFDERCRVIAEATTRRDLDAMMVDLPETIAKKRSNLRWLWLGGVAGIGTIAVVIVLAVITQHDDTAPASAGRITTPSLSAPTTTSVPASTTTTAPSATTATTSSLTSTVKKPGPAGLIIKLNMDSDSALGKDKAKVCSSRFYWCITIDNVVLGSSGPISSGCHLFWQLAKESSPDVYDKGYVTCGEAIHLDVLEVGEWRLDANVELNDGTTSSAAYRFVVIDP
ncbi:DUF1707 SHOCT-like domain-containing protein [Nocardia sp. CA-119907]|uniref:DUF1707 SHOCT-like domain-containing protein n=1 Tax=Nocardia sp. CA-119907 TaxID=3239973 RepID=UPI003D99FB3A